MRAVVFALGSDVPTFDERAYTELATQLATGEGFERGGRPETHILPLFPLLHALPIAIGLDPHLAGRWTGLVTSAAAVPAAMWAIAPLVGRRLALAAGLLVLVHPRLLVTAERIQPEALGAVWLLLFAGCWGRAVLAGTGSRRRSRAVGWAAGVGVATAAAYLTRPEGILLLLWLWVVVAVHDRRRWRRWLAATAVAVLLSAPYLAYLHRVTGSWTITGKSDWVYRLGVIEAESGNRPIEIEALDDPSYQVGSALGHWRDEPRAAAAGYLRRLGFAARYLGEAVWWPLLIAIGAAAAIAARRPALAGWLAAAGLLLVIPLGVVHARHVLPYLPLLLASTAFLPRWWRERADR